MISKILPSLPATLAEAPDGRAPELGVASGSASEVVAWEVEIHYMSCVVFATTKAKARWLAVKAYWDAYSANGSWPHTNVARKPLYDKFPHRNEAKAFSPEYVRSLC